MCAHAAQREVSYKRLKGRLSTVLAGRSVVGAINNRKAAPLGERGEMP